MKATYFRSLFSVGLASALLFAAPAAGLAQSNETATRSLERRHEDVNRLLRQPAQNDAARQRRSERLREILNGLLDYQELSRRALAEHWNERSPAERQRFVSLLQQLVERNYEGNLERIVDFQVSYERETTQSNGLTVVQTSARSRTQRRQPPVAIAYSMQRAGDGWKVVDVTTDGVSMVDNYRNQFHRIIARDGWNELIARMQRRLEHGGQDT